MARVFLLFVSALALCSLVAGQVTCPTLKLSGPQELFPEDANGKQKLFFGKYLRVDGDWMIVGAYGHTNYKGAAYLFQNNGYKWRYKQTLKADVRQGRAYYGLNVDIYGLTAVVGEPYSHTSGRAHVYEYKADSKEWVTTQVLTPPGDARYNRPFGYGVGLELNTLAVAARYGAKWNADFTRVERSGAGSLWVYTRPGSGSPFELEDVIYGPHQWEQWGDDVVVRGTVPGDAGEYKIIVGSPRHRPDKTGGAYVYHKVNGVFTEQALLQPDETGLDRDYSIKQHHGEGLAMGQYTAVTGAERAPSEIGTKTGCAYLWVLENGTWVQKQRLNPTTTDKGGVKHGQRLALNEEAGVIVVGSWGARKNGLSKAGSFRYYVRCSDGTYSGGPRVTLDTPGENDQFGNVMAISGNTIVAGAPKRDSGDDPALQDRGAAYVYTYELE